MTNRQSLVEPFVWLTSRMTQPQSKSLPLLEATAAYKRAIYREQSNIFCYA